MKDTAGSLLKDKTGNIYTVAPDTTVLMALKMMAEKNVGALLVMDLEKIAGIITERDYARKCILHEKESDTIAVSEIMTSELITVDTVETVEKCMSIMMEKGIRHLPVLEEGRLVGLISIRDVLGRLISKQKTKIHDLENLLSGKGYESF